MPAEKIATTFVNNGPDDAYTNVLRVQWGARGGCPQAPDGWVNAGFAHITISQETEVTGKSYGIELDPEEIGHLIRVLKRVKRQAFPVDMHAYVGGYITPSTPMGQLPVVPVGPAPGATPRLSMTSVGNARRLTNHYVPGLVE